MFAIHNNCAYGYTRDACMVSHMQVAHCAKHKKEEILQTELFNTIFDNIPFDSLPGQACVLDSDGKIVSVNKPWIDVANLFSHGPKNTFLNKIYLDFLANVKGTEQEYSNQAALGIHSVLNGSQTSFLMEYPCDVTEQIFWYNCRAVSFNQLGNRFVLVLHEDVSLLKKAQQNEIQARTDLLTALEREKDARCEAESANRHREDFLANLSHELRTPLGAVLGFSELLSCEPGATPEFCEAVEALRRNALLLKELVDQLMDAAQIAGGKSVVPHAPVDVTNVLKTAVEGFLVPCKQKGITLNFKPAQETFVVRGDSTQLTQIFWNFLSNSVKFTHPNGCINIRIERKDHTWVAIYISDTGIGISKEFLPHVFERFRQQESGSTRKYGGLGLGLSIVKQLVDRHQGELKIESVGPGTGTQVQVCFPLKVTKPI